jgi:phosphonate transport system substrate-binding protein
MKLALPMNRSPITLTKTLLLSGLLVACHAAFAQATCANRGELDTLYCDDNNDMVADAPANNKYTKPNRLLIAFGAVEDPSVYQMYNPFIEYLSKCSAVPTQTFTSNKEADIIEAMRTGKVHIASYATGGTMFAVNLGGGVPFAGKGKSAENRPDYYKLLLLVKNDSTFKKMLDLKGKHIAHTSQSSNSGNLAPRALFPQKDLTPDKDYKITYTGKHDKSILGVQYGFWDAAAVASDVFERMIARGEVKRGDFRILFESEGFPPDAFSMAHNLEPKLAEKIKTCFTQYKFPAAMSKQLEGNDRFFPLSYKSDWQLVRLVAKNAGQKIDRSAYEKMLGRPSAVQ